MMNVGYHQYHHCCRDGNLAKSFGDIDENLLYDCCSNLALCACSTCSTRFPYSTTAIPCSAHVLLKRPPKFHVGMHYWPVTKTHSKLQKKMLACGRQRPMNRKKVAFSSSVAMPVRLAEDPDTSLVRVSRRCQVSCKTNRHCN